MSLGTPGQGTGEPWVLELQPAPSAVDVFRCLADLPWCIFLDSAAAHPQLGRWSYIAADPFNTLELTETSADPLAELADCLAPLTSVRRRDLPPFQGGAAGLLSYDLGATLERLPSARYDEFRLPRLAMALYDTLVAVDHVHKRVWIISQGWPAQSLAARERRALARIAAWRERIARGLADRSAASLAWSPAERVELQGEHHQLAGGLLSNFDPASYRRTVERAIEYIVAGDLFQVNLAQRLIYPARDSAAQLYLQLRAENPAPFAAYFDLGSTQIVSASPERFLAVDGRLVETRPIKGTRARRLGAEADLFAAHELSGSEKDRAENVMIVDLMRNDLSRVCDPDSVRVSQLCQIEQFEYVQHLVSAVTGELAADRTVIDLIRAAFPGGSITGAPKIRAMEIIAELEPHARGAYCGSLGYLSWDGALDLSILIRTITAARGWWQFPVGGGIVAQSDPAREYAETWQKAAGLQRGIERLRRRQEL